ncbi:hypothetical protein NDU88_003030 [Pleurodeles waltl]|uniref:Uncharacterized protein n=1 Tax=Pleurodeles waltl TaxID=8319 RepID=A0AAV7T521_PLEWA|nr:hypothetical protein NDU88_003030 [Pleurodeles waltl]
MGGRIHIAHRRRYICPVHASQFRPITVCPLTFRTVGDYQFSISCLPSIRLYSRQSEGGPGVEANGWKATDGELAAPHSAKGERAACNCARCFSAFRSPAATGGLH